MRSKYILRRLGGLVASRSVIALLKEVDPGLELHSCQANRLEVSLLPTALRVFEGVIRDQGWQVVRSV